MSVSPLPTVSMLLISQRDRWERGDCILVEKLLEEQPALRDQAEPILELLYHEMLLSEERGQPPQLDDYLRRFPHLANELRMQFEVHTALSSDGSAAAAQRAAGHGAAGFD